MIHAFLLIGQSNMAGRGALDEAISVDTTHIKILRNGRWQNMFRPINPDRRFSGTNLAESFAERYAEEHQVDAGLICCADGGTNIDQWCEGGLLFDHACYMAELASRTSTIAGVLWHQGESDCEPDRYPLYEEKLRAVLTAFRKRLQLQDVPFLLGGLGEYLGNNADPVYHNYGFINRALSHVAETMPFTGFVPAEGLTSGQDSLHFSAQSLHTFGLRYYREFLKYENKNQVFAEKMTEDSKIRTEIEDL